LAASPQQRIGFAPSLKDDKVVRGKDGRLFLDNDSNRVVAQHSGELRFTSEQLEQWRYLLETRTAWLERGGARHFFVVAPNSHSVYEDKLPDHVRSAPERPIHQLIGHLGAGGSYAHLLYPVDELIAQRPANVYARTSSRWTELGAFVAYQALMAEITSEADIRVLTLGDVEIHEQERAGDLGHKLEPRERSPYAWLDLIDPRARIVARSGAWTWGFRVEYQSEGNLDCLVFGDCSAIRVLPFLAESFKRLVFVPMINLDFSLVSELRPDVVVKFLSERFLIQVPVDLPGPNHRVLEAAGRAGGDVVPEQAAETTRMLSRRPSRAATPA
jgi:alginate O-acetyltransferase complex protein AlgJ